MSISNLGIISVIFYTFIILVICIKSSKHLKEHSSGQSFFLGNGTKTFVLLFTTVASTFSTWVIMGAPASTFANGHTWLATVTLCQMTMAFTCGYLGPRFWVLRKEFGLVTQSDLVVKYYRTNIFRYILGICFIIALMTSTIAQFKAVGLAINTMSGGLIPYWAATLYVGIVICVYVYFGGFHGEALIDTFQGLLFSAVLWGGLVLVIWKAGGISSLFAQVAEKGEGLLLYPGRDAVYDPKFAISFCLVTIFGGIVHPGFWQRYYAAKDTHTLKRMSIWFPIMVSVGVTLTGGLVGLAANNFDLQLGANDTVFQVLMSSVFSPYLSILVTLAILAAGMSTVAGNMNGSSMIISYDFVRILGKETDDFKLRNVGRTCIIILIAVSYFLALNTPSSITMLIQLMAAFNMAALYPVIGIFVWKRATIAGCLSGMIGGFLAVCFTNFVVKNMFGIVAGGWGFGVGMFLFISVSLFTKPIPQEWRDEFMAPLRRRQTISQVKEKQALAE